MAELTVEVGTGHGGPGVDAIYSIAQMAVDRVAFGQLVEQGRGEVGIVGEYLLEPATHVERLTFIALHADGARRDWHQ